MERRIDHPSGHPAHAATLRLAVVGLAAVYGHWRNWKSFAQGVYDGTRMTAGGGEPLAAASEALRDAGIAPGEAVAVAALGTPAQAIARAWQCRGPVWNASPDALFGAVTWAAHQLARGQVNAVLLVSGEAVGAGAVVLQAEAGGRRTYALLTPTSTETVAYAELLTTPTPDVLRTIRTAAAPHTCALGSVAANLTAPSPMAGLLRVVAALHQRFIPPTPEGLTLHPPEAWEATPFYLPAEPHPWFAPRGMRRRAALHLGGATALTLMEPRRAISRRPHDARRPTGYLIPLSGPSGEAVLTALRDVEARLKAAPDEVALQAEVQRALAAYHPSRYAVALVGRDGDDLRRETARALQGVAQALRTGEAWQSPRGSYFTPRPLGREGGVAFVYPGAFTAYVGLGRHLFQDFPTLYERLDALTADAGRLLSERLLYPRTLRPPTAEMREAWAARLAGDPIALIEAGTGFAVLFTTVMRDLFGVHPQAAFGYSLGEVSMLWAAGVWQDGDAGLEAWHSSPLFTRRLAGPKETVREQWGLPADVGDDFWTVLLLKAPVAAVQAALAAEPRVFLTMINTPTEVVIAGETAACHRVARALRCHALPLPQHAVIHNPLARTEFDRFMQLYRRPLAHRPATRFYSAAEDTPLPLEEEALARTLAEMSCTMVDFPKLVERVYADGARLFVELGPQRTCSRWIEHILRGRPHVVAAVDRRGVPSTLTILGAVARLVSHGVAVDLSPLREQEVTAQGQVADGTPSTTSYQRYLLPLRRAAAREHTAFLEIRQDGLRQIGAGIELQMAVAEHALRRRATHLPLRFDQHHLRAFAEGDVTACFGERYAIYAGRRLPRIPNGELLLMSRVEAVTGHPGQLDGGASLVAAYDVPQAAWFWRGDETLPPYAVLMEMALQPCGFLSAYLETPLVDPQTDFYFRNLDGRGRLLRAVPLRGRTVHTEVRLLSTARVQGVIIQRYTFALNCGGTRFFEGEASFGYFTAAALRRQTGLDGRASPPPWGKRRGERLSVPVGETTHPLHLLDEVWWVEEDGRHGQGYLRGEKRVSPHDWYFRCHFYQDPVMPGSLGVQAMLEAMAAYGRRLGEGGPFVPLAPQETVWRYRGQIVPQDDHFALEVHLTDVARTPSGLVLRGEGSLWKEKLRIYEVQGLGIITL